MYYLQEQSSTDFFILFRKTNEKYDSVIDPYSRVSKAAFPDPPQLLRMQMKCISGGCGSPGRAGAGPHVSANTFKQIAVKGGNGNITSHPHYRSLINGCKVRRQAAVCMVKVHSGTREGSSYLLVMLSEPGAKGAWRCVSCLLKHAKISVILPWLGELLWLCLPGDSDVCPEGAAGGSLPSILQGVTQKTTKTFC